MIRILFLYLIFATVPCFAQIKEYKHLYDIDLNEKIPMTWRLEKEYSTENSNYNWKYDYTWKMPTTFDSDFKNKTINFANIEKRINSEDEESLLRDLKHLPKIFYPYIGPALHNTPGLSGKILNLPGIKETKNKFPERIASHFSNIPNIEFASPEMYLYLMPQFMGEDLEIFEYPTPTNQLPDIPKVRIKPEFLEKLQEKVPMTDFALGKSRKPTPDGIRHYNANANTPLSKADVKAFVNTLDGLLQFKKQGKNEIRLIIMDALINYYDEKNGIDKNVSYLKSVVNPCQGIARKVKWSGLRENFQTIIGEQSFGIDDWAYTCDKTIKAYRVANISNATLTSLKILRKGYVYDMIEPYGYSKEEMQQFKYFIEATIHLFDTTPEDVKAVRPFRKTLQNRLPELGSTYMGTPIILTQ